MASSPWVADVSEPDFLERVVEQSRVRPVVVDFWAPWCGPCRALSPLLEGLAAEFGGQFFLAKINTDQNPNVAGEFGVSGIPAVFAVKDGEVVDAFTGLMPEAEIRAFLGRIIPGAAGGPLADADQLETADPAKAEEAYRAALAADPKSPAARVGLARLLLATPGHDAEAADLLRDVVSEEFAPETQRLTRVLKLRTHPAADADLTAARQAVTATPDDARVHLILGKVLAARGEYVPALDALIAAAERDKELAKADVREVMVEIFHILGVRSPDSDAYRDKLQPLLY